MAEMTSEQIKAEEWRRRRASEAAASNQDDALVSVVIPIYNVADFLEECLDSILAQTHTNMEIICVNDGSTDSSLSIMRAYEAKDPRVKVIDKPNAGYGNSVNHGLRAATGDWVSIIEPDDLIHPRMYSDLLSQAVYKDGHLADIVKGSYWLYFDLKDGTEPYIETPHLTNCMPHRRTDFTVTENWEIMRHHPCVWAALYRRDFLEAFGIRMTEPPGAGWADNPWFFNTMLRAQAIVWVPAAYYYYRQTNPNASSKLGSYNMPFDRLRDIRGIYDELNITDTHLINVLYQRSFNYIINSVLEEFHFPEKDPELQALIREVLEWMDEKELMGMSAGIDPYYKDYYRDFMGIRLSKLHRHIPSSKPRISIILPLKDDREGLWGTVDTFALEQFDDFEVLCYDCGSTDRSVQIIEGVAQKDRRFVLSPNTYQSVTEAFNAGIEDARADWLLFVRSGFMLPDRASFRKLFEQLDACEDPDGVVLMPLAHGAALTRKQRESKKVFSRVVSTYPEGTPLMEDLALEMFTKPVRRSYLQAKGLRFTEGDNEGVALACQLLLQTPQVLEVLGIPAEFAWHYGIMRKNLVDADDLYAFHKDRLDVIANVLGTTGEDERTLDVVRFVMLLLLEGAVNDLGECRSGREYYEKLRKLYRTPEWALDTCSKTRGLAFNARLRLENAFGNTFEKFLMERRTEDARHVGALNNRINQIINSGSYRVSRGLSKNLKRILHITNDNLLGRS